MEHPQFNPIELLAELGITDAMSDTPPEWVTQAITAEQRLVLCKLMLHSATQGMQPLSCMAVLLFRLAQQPGLPPQAPGFLVFAAAEMLAAHMVDLARRNRGARDMSSALAIVNQAELQILGEAVATEDEDQDAGVPLGVGA